VSIGFLNVTSNPSPGNRSFVALHTLCNYAIHRPKMPDCNKVWLLSDMAATR